MYYSAVLKDAPPTLLEVLEINDIDCKVFGVESVQGQKLLEIANDHLVFELPVIMAGEILIGHGADAWYDLFMHAQDNPHVHWEAGDCDE